MLYGPATMRLRTQAQLQAFMARALGRPQGVLPGVDFTTQEVLAFHDPGSADPLAPCQSPRLGKLYDYGTIIGYFLELPTDLGACDSEERPAGYEFVRIARTDKPIEGIPEYVP
jgi:hypothetical protein